MATLWIIDGYNFIRQSRRFAEWEAEAPAEGRDAALRWLGKFCAETGERVRVVFDAYSSLAREPKTEKKYQIEIWLSRGGYTADEEIIALAQSLGESCIVVSSDREVITGALRGGASILSSQEFERELGKIFARSEPLNPPQSRRGPAKGAAFQPPKEKKKAYLLLRKYQ